MVNEKVSYSETLNPLEVGQTGERALHRVFSTLRAQYFIFSTLRSLQRALHHISLSGRMSLRVFSPLEGHQWHRVGHCIEFSPLQGQCRGRCTKFSPLLRHFITPNHWKVTIEDTALHFLHQKGTVGGTAPSFLHCRRAP